MHICECASIQANELKVTGWTYLYNHINYLHLCWRPRALSDLQQAHVRQPWLAVVAIETRAYVCGCVFACVQDPDMPYRLGPALSQGSRPDMTPVRVSFHLGRRDDRDGPGLDSAFSWNGKEGNCSIGVVQENVQAQLLWDSQLWKWAFLRWMYFFFEDIKVSRLLSSPFLFLSFGGCVVSCLTGARHDNEGVCVCWKDGTEVNKTK